MKKNLKTKIEIPSELEVTITEKKIQVKGPEGENSRKMDLRNVKIAKEGNAIILSCDKATKREKKIINTMASHLRNMIKGVQNKFEYKLKICSSHFPMTVEMSGNKAVVKNFLGEKVPRNVKIEKNSDVKISGDLITINSVDKEIAGQCAANFETATKVRNRDRRIFQDGIFMINKAGRNI